jgi:D-arabinose 1-dehydrogenase-like Zn-dependent alcohol dehydrogenase
MSRMRRQAFSDYGQPLREIAGEAPTPRGSEVLVRVGHCGVCHSDIHLHEGYFDLGSRKLELAGDRALPFTLGHEIEGSIEAAGADAKGAEPGRRVVVYPWIGCGACALCRRGEEQLCLKPRQIGIQVDGGYATHVMVPHPRYLLDYDPIPPALAGTYMCSGLSAYAAVEKLGAAAEHHPVLIVGLGGVGMMGFSFLRARSQHPPIVVEIDATKRQYALEHGAAAAFDPGDPAARKGIMAASGGGVVGALDFVGSEKSTALAFGSLTKGGKLVLVGLIGGEGKFPLPTFPLKGLSILGSYVGSLDEAKAMLALVRAGGIPPIPVRSRPLAEAQAALEELRGGRTIGRSVLVP